MFWRKKKSKKKTVKNLFAWRVGLSKTLGLAIGLFSAGYILNYVPDLGGSIALGLVLWFIIEGAFIGMAGVMTHHPVWQSWRFPAWFRGLWIGLIMHLTLFLLLQDQVNWSTVVPDWVTFAPLRDPLILVMIEGALLGALWDSLITATTGEGKALTKSLKSL